MTRYKTSWMQLGMISQKISLRTLILRAAARWRVTSSLRMWASHPTETDLQLPQVLQHPKPQAQAPPEALPLVERRHLVVPKLQTLLRR